MLARLQVGTRPYLKNFRKGLRYQASRCKSELEDATARGDVSAAAELQHRLDWIFAKQRYLDVEHVMVLDKPSWQHGRALEYGGLQEDAMTSMSAREIAEERIKDIAVERLYLLSLIPCGMPMACHKESQSRFFFLAL